MFKGVQLILPHYINNITEMISLFNPIRQIG